MGVSFHLVIKCPGAVAPYFLRIAGLQKQIDFVEDFPHLEGNLITDLTGIFASGADTTKNRIRILPVEGHELSDGSTVGLGIMLKKSFFITHRPQDRHPVLLDPLVINRTEINQKLNIDVQ